jgi:hypothetical protein
MNLHTALRAALRALTANLLRSVLTMLGIIIGVGAVITMLAVGRGATERVQEQIKGLGSNIVLVVPGSLSAAGVRLGAQTRSRFTEEDAEALAREVPEVQVAAPSSRTTAQAVAQNANWNTTIFGTTNDYLEAREWPLAAGRLFEAAEQQGSAKVAWLGQTAARELFADDDPLGQTVRVRGVPFTVVGVLAAKGQNAVGQDQDDIVIVPMSTFRNRIWNAGGNVRRIWSIHVKVRAGADMARAEESMRTLLRQRLRVPDGGDDTFSIRNLSEVLQAQEESSRDDRAAGRCRGREPAGGRHRHHEHHAGERDRAHARDRPAHGRGRAWARHPGAVPDRIGHAQPGGRRHRRGAGRAGHLGGGARDRLERRHGALVRAAGRGFCGPGGRVLWLLPGAACGASAAHRRTAARVSISACQRRPAGASSYNPLLLDSQGKHKPVVWK